MTERQIEYLRNKISGEYEIFFNWKSLLKTLKEDYKMEEKWKQVIVYGELYDYEVSNKGRVRNIRTKELLKPFYTNNDYWNVNLWSNKDKKIHIYGIHRLMGFAFIPIPKKYINNGYTYQTLVINHKDGYKRHNMIYNLEWCTVKENMTHAIDNNLIHYLGQNSHLSKMNNETAIKICELISKGKNNKFISEKLNVSEKSVQHIRAKECWTHISKDYVFPSLGTSKPNTIPIETIHKICKILEEKKYSDVEIGKMCGVSREYVKDIRNHKRQKKISKDYNF